MAVKPKTTAPIVTRPLAVIKSGTPCYYNTEKVLKVRSKTLMNEQGKIYSVPDSTLVQVSS